MPDGVQDAWQLDVINTTRNAILKSPEGQNMKGFAYLFAPTAPQEYEILGPILKNRKQVMQGGEAIDSYQIYREYGTAAFVRPGQTYQPSIQNVIVKSTVPWRYMNVNWSVLDDELQKNRGPEKLMPFLGARMTAAKQDAALLIENEFWANPSATSDTQPLTASYWIVPINAPQVYEYDQTGAAGALALGVNKWGNWQGSLPSNGTFTDVGGVDPGGAYTYTSGFATSTYNRWRNWNAQWSNSGGNYTDIDGRNLGHAMDALQWKPPAFLGGDLSATKLGMMRLCSCQAVKDSMEQFQRDTGIAASLRRQARRRDRGSAGQPRVPQRAPALRREVAAVG